MKQVLILLFLVSTICHSQKQYVFDYFLEYDLTYFKDSIKIKDHRFYDKTKTSKFYILTNSTDNSYEATITELDTLRYNLVFIENNGIAANVNFFKSEFHQAEFLNLKCEHTGRYVNRYKFQTKHYDFTVLNDTIIKDKTLGRYKLESNKPKRIKRKKLGTAYYLIDKETSFHLPILSHATAYEEWKKEKGLPNGIYTYKYFIDYFGRLHSEQKLISYRKINKKITIDKACYDKKLKITY